ncbi:tRNA (N6-isopentenyl adenosine(37)-C2)-methylthiotransferase MiaB [Acetobacterium paludosum]|uniref:tRNA-2-methylthio-N(6)-dimethylallyladenosine synthase n=1 Tax=Acetobacterium paludosum TaxID=52693 RepID=A0A923HXI8_9FIRM|nr:tRNA (N6-isopentenyl adenosine(37)-C2)-methylthiotransferase MiaB [Acetobacterium paludosum]MBC3889427.1 tRNA (N6-isopentenyl adenosine(37)-C2)-methylthiotransferase MiaB [Acetobacterium paludosum]
MKHFNKKLTFFIKTFGCAMNENDSEKLSGMLKALGYVEENDINKVGLVIFNTCSIRENADDRVFGNIGAIKTVKKTNPDLILAVCGCMMQQPEIVKKIVRTYPQVDLVFGTHNIHQFPELLNNFLVNGQRMIEVWEDSDAIVEDLPTDRRYPFKAFVTIMNGCNNFCTYCIVPYTRGREVSRQPGKIFNEVQALVADGCVEVTLLGQNVNSYGNDLEKDVNFANLLRKLNTIENLKRIRFMTSHPKDLTDAVIEAIADCDKVCNYIHLPIQSGSTRILKAMNRKYTQEDIINRVQKMKDRIPDVAITTDIIVGFPGETEEDFMETLKVIKACKFDSAFTFLYSIRTGTPAATMENQIPEEIKHDRINRCLEVLHQIGHDINQNYQDRVVEVLVEETSRNNPDRMTGRTRTGKLVIFEGDLSDIGKQVMIKITDAKTFSLDGKKIEQEETDGRINPYDDPVPENS